MNALMRAIRCLFGDCPPAADRAAVETVEETKRLVEEVAAAWEPIRQRTEEERKRNPALDAALRRLEQQPSSSAVGNAFARRGER